MIEYRVRNEKRFLPELPFVPYTSERDSMGRLNGYRPDKDADVLRRRNYSEIKPTAGEAIFKGDVTHSSIANPNARSTA